MSMTAQQFKARLILHKHGRTEVELKLDRKAIARKEQLLTCTPNIKARCVFGVRVWLGEGLVYAGNVRVVFSDPRYAWPPTRMFALAQVGLLEQEVKNQWHHLDWHKDLRIELMLENPRIDTYYHDTQVRDTLKEEVKVVGYREIEMPPIPIQTKQEQPENAILPALQLTQPLVREVVTAPERTPNAREVLARMAAEAREKRGIQKS